VVFVWRMGSSSDDKPIDLSGKDGDKKNVVETDGDGSDSDEDEDDEDVEITEPPKPPDSKNDVEEEEEDKEESSEEEEIDEPIKIPTPPTPAIIPIPTKPKLSPMDAFRQQALDEHNAYRKQHGVPPLTLDDGLNELAQNWAKHLAATGSFAHRPNNNYGENIAMSTAGYDTAVRMWYDEYKNYNFHSPPSRSNSAIGHFTQVVWKSTKRLGIAYAYSQHKRAYYVVANYDPAGNFNNRFTENVFDK